MLPKNILPDTASIEYDNEKHKQFLINMFTKYSYVVITDEYLESTKLNKGIILKPRTKEDDEIAVLTQGVQ